MNKRDLLEYCLAQKFKSCIETVLKEAEQYRQDSSGDSPGTDLDWAMAGDFIRAMERLGIISFSNAIDNEVPSTKTTEE